MPNGRQDGAPVVVAQFDRRTEAELAAGLLRHHGIAVEVVADDMAGLRPDLAASGGVWLRVPGAMADAARALLAAPLAGEEEDGATESGDGG